MFEKALSYPRSIFAPVALLPKRVLRKLVPNFDQWTIKTVVPLMGSYVGLYGILQTNGVQFDEFSWQYATIILPIMLIDGFKGLIETFTPSSYKWAPEELEKVTVIIAAKDAERCLGKTLSDLCQRFPTEQIIVASNGSTDSTVAIAQRYGVRYMDIAEGIGKVRAINAALALVKTPYVLLLDDDTLIGNAKIPTGLLDRGYEAVAFRLFVNTSTWITKIQQYEYRKGNDLGKRFYDRRAAIQNVSGAIGLFKIEELQRQATIHTGEFSGEDSQRTMLVHLLKGSRGVVLSSSVIYTDPPATVSELFKQRTLGWFPGLYSNCAIYFRVMFARHTPLSLRFDCFYNLALVMGMDILRLISFPIIFLYPWYLAVMYVVYVALETASYLRMGRKDPYWVVLVYPFFGLFGFLTRVGAFMVFMYRRIVARSIKATFYDDYRTAPRLTKFISSVFVSLSLATLLLFESVYGITLQLPSFW